MVRPAGFEPATSSVGDWRSIQLSYGREVLSIPRVFFRRWTYNFDVDSVISKADKNRSEIDLVVLIALLCRGSPYDDDLVTMADGLHGP